jgi:hypothetical protein
VITVKKGDIMPRIAGLAKEMVRLKIVMIKLRKYKRIQMRNQWY